MTNTTLASLTGLQMPDDVTVNSMLVKRNVSFNPAVPWIYLPKNEFFYYEGSQTEPECQDTVTWIVNRHTQVITDEQIAQLKALLDPDTVKFGGNYRDI